MGRMNDALSITETFADQLADALRRKKEEKKEHLKQYIDDHRMAVIFLEDGIRRTVDVRDRPGVAHEFQKFGYPDLNNRIERLEHARDYFNRLLLEAEAELLFIKQEERKAKKEAEDA